MTTKGSFYFYLAIFTILSTCARIEMGRPFPKKIHIPISDSSSDSDNELDRIVNPFFESHRNSVRRNPFANVTAPRDPPRGTTRGSQRNSTRGSQRNSPRGSSGSTPRGSPRESPRGSRRGSPNENPRGTQRESPRGLTRHSSRNRLRNSQGDSAMDSPRGSPRHSSRDSMRSSSIDSQMHTSMDSPMETSADSMRDSSIESHRGSSTDSRRGRFRDSPINHTTRNRPTIPWRVALERMQNQTENDNRPGTSGAAQNLTARRRPYTIPQRRYGNQGRPQTGPIPQPDSSDYDWL